MKKYEIRLTDTAWKAIQSQARFIAIDQKDPLNAERWIQQIWSAVESLESYPLRAALANENEVLAFELRQLVVARTLILFSVDEDLQTVWIVALRSGGQEYGNLELPKLSRPSDPPRDQ